MVWCIGNQVLGKSPISALTLGVPMGSNDMEKIGHHGPNQCWEIFGILVTIK